MSEKQAQDLQRKKEEDLKRRRVRINVRTQMDNAIYAFMYAVESHDIEVEKKAEDYLIDLLFTPDTFDKCVKAIGGEEKRAKDLITSSRKIAEKTVKLALAEDKDTVSRPHVEQAIRSLQRECWPFY